MKKEELVEYADYLLKAALGKTQNMAEAEELVQDTLLGGLLAIAQGKEIINPESFLMTILNRKFYDRLRKKYRMPVVSMDVVADIPYVDQGIEALEQSIDAENIRRCLANLTQIYREVMVKYYMYGQSVKQISYDLNVPENTVKSRLDAGRKHVRKDFDMNSYEKQSYEPEYLWMSNSGHLGTDNEPFSLVGGDRITMNLLILAYEKPVTIPELAKAIGISTAYIESIVEKLVKGELMKKVADKVYTDFIIYTQEDRVRNFEAEKKLAGDLYKDIWKIVEQGLMELQEQEYYQKQKSSQKRKLDSFFVTRTLQRAVNHIRDEVCGGMQPFETYPDRPNGGKWYAMGNQYSKEDMEHSDYTKYYISGERINGQNDYRGCKHICICEYDSLLGLSQMGYQPLSTDDMLNMLFAIHSENEEDLKIINPKCFESIPKLKKLGILAEDATGKTVVDVPIIGWNDRFSFYNLSEKYDEMIRECFGEQIRGLMKGAIKLPGHLKSVPDWQRYMECCSKFPMLVVWNAYENGLFQAGYDLQDNPAPAMFLAWE